MSEHRYGVHDCPNGLYYLRDVTDHSVYVHRSYGYLYSDYKDDIELVSTLLNELADKVDKRQATINKLKEENEKMKKRLSLYEMDEDEVDHYLRTHPMPTTITNERTIIPLDMRHRW